jgi:ribulose-phosphate 3-epimerase
MPIPRDVYRELRLLPSILSADFSRLGEQVTAVMDAGVSIIHVDVMDGHFVPNLTIGPVVLQSLERLVHERGGLFSVHLMIEEPEKYLEVFVNAGADALSVHVETCPHLYHTLTTIKALGAGAGVALNPGTPVSAVEGVLDMADYFLVMTVNPGFGGQEMIEPALRKVRQLRAVVPAQTGIEVDGGVHEGNIRHVVEMGADWVVAGSAVFNGGEPHLQAQKLQGLMVVENPAL